MKKTTLLLALVLVLALIPISAIAEEQPTHISILYNDNAGYPYSADWPVWAALEEATNTELEIIPVPSSDYGTKWQLLLSTGEAPDIILRLSNKDIQNYIPSGVILPISDYFDRMPLFSRLYEEWNLEPEIEQLRQLDGKVYLVASFPEENGSAPEWTLRVREDVLSKLGIGAINTMDEFYDAMVAVKAEYPDSYVWSERWHGDAISNLASEFDACYGWSSTQTMVYNDEKDEYFFAPAYDGQREFCRFMAKVCAEGLLDTEFVSQADDNFLAKATNDQVFFSYSADWFTYNSQLGDEGVNWKVTASPYWEEKGPVMRSQLRSGVNMILNAELANDDRLDAVLQFADFLAYSEESAIINNLGILGLTYEIKEDGSMDMLPNVGHKEYHPDAPIKMRDYGFRNGSLPGSIPAAISQIFETEDNIRLKNDWKAQRTIVLPAISTLSFDEEQSQREAMLSTPLEDYVKTMTTRFILGELDVEEDWDEYLAGLESKNWREYEEFYNEVYEANK